MFVTFTSNSQHSYNGWSAHYITGPNVGINSASELDFYTVFPNPAHSTINIINSDSREIHDITIYTIDGKAIKTYFTESLNKTLITLDISYLPKGMFFIRINDNKGSFSHKIVKL